MFLKPLFVVVCDKAIENEYALYPEFSATHELCDPAWVTSPIRNREGFIRLKVCCGGKILMSLMLLFQLTTLYAIDSPTGMAGIFQLKIIKQLMPASSWPNILPGLI